MIVRLTKLAIAQVKIHTLMTTHVASFRSINTDINFKIFHPFKSILLTKTDDHCDVKCKWTCDYSVFCESSHHEM